MPKKWKKHHDEEFADFCEVNSDKHFELKNVETLTKPSYKSEAHYKEMLRECHEQLEEYQMRLYAQHSKSMLIILQGMDTSGKDGVIKHVMTGVNPQGCQVVSFKSPTPTELDHDFLWRVSCAMPRRGHIGIFNRSYYEEVLITHVHPELLSEEHLPPGENDTHKFWHHRYEDIVNHEKYLHRQGYEIVKIMIHISKEEQKKRLEDRFRDPKKHWKISRSDIRERKFWKEYQRAYELSIRHTASKCCPWYVVPGDDKMNARLMISKILVSRFKKMELDYPKLTDAQMRKLSELKEQLLK